MSIAARPVSRSICQTKQELWNPEACLEARRRVGKGGTLAAFPLRSLSNINMPHERNVGTPGSEMAGATATACLLDSPDLDVVDREGRGAAEKGLGVHAIDLETDAVRELELARARHARLMPLHPV